LFSEKTLADMDTPKGFTAVRRSEEFIRGILANTPKPTEQVVRNASGLVQNGISGHKFLTTSWRSIQKMMNDSVESLKKVKDPEVVANLKKAAANEARARSMVDNAMNIMKRSVPLLAQLREKAKKAGAKV